ncbi:hypothetical protein B0H34DRAFT_660582 [Crassisporium funariophilum]|nr:hypothetical protein B0H34DRAFT_660582 [Crassisporium funariophilum]
MEETAPVAPRRIVYVLRSLSARLALLITTFSLLLFSAIFGACTYLVLDMLDPQITDLHRLAIYFHMFNCLFIGGSCIFGLYAATSTKAQFSHVFMALLSGQFVFGIASGVVCLYLVFSATPSPDQVTNCAGLVQNVFLSQMCHPSTLTKGVCMGLFEFLWMLEILAMYIANQYATQLQQEENLKACCSPKEEHELFFW